MHKRNRPTRSLRSPRRGVVLLEIVIAMAIFVGAGLLTLSILSNSFAGLERAESNAFALDLARSKLAEIETGMMSIGDMQGDLVDRVGSFELLDAMEYHGLDDDSSIWRMSITTTPTAYRGLTLVEVRVYRENAAGEETAMALMRQLIELRERAVDEYEQDDLLDGLPAGGARR